MQLTTDGHRPYLQAVEDAFGSDIDYAMLIKLYGSDPDAGRFSPPVVIAVEMRRITGDPDPSYISTSYVERQNLTRRSSTTRPRSPCTTCTTTSPARTQPYGILSADPGDGGGRVRSRRDV